MRAAHPTATVTLWAEDEHRLGLLPVMRRVWAPRGQRPTAAVRRKYEWLSVYGFVRPRTGASWWGLLPTVNATAMSLALATFARDEGIDADHRAVLVLDQAGWHIAHDLEVPAGIDLVLLPAQSPELQPPSGCGRSSTSRWPTAPSLTWTRWRRSSSTAVAPWRLIPRGSKPTPTSIGGRPNRLHCSSDYPDSV